MNVPHTANLLLSLLLISLACSDNSGAVPAAPFVHELHQPDGNSFRARRHGDENGAGWETEEGYTIVFGKDDSSWWYAEDDGKGALVASHHRVGRDSVPDNLKRKLRPGRGSGKSRGIKSLPREAMAKISPAASLNPSSPLTRENSTTASSTGYIPVVLANFPDTSPTFTTSDFANLLFSTGNWSLADYYSEVSHGSFTVNGGPAGVMGWVTAANTHDYYGGNDRYGEDSWPGDFVHEAVAANDAAVDFSPYDQDGDCTVDIVAIVHQGTGEEASVLPSDIWSHRWTLAEAYSSGYSHYGPYTTNDRCLANPAKFVTIDNYIIQPEKLDESITTIGTFAHEYGHALGLIDLYDTDGGADEGIGDWSLMARGGWNGLSRRGDRPAHLDPWSKYRLNWITPSKMSNSEPGKQFASVEATGSCLQIRSGSPEVASGEYFLLENRQNTGFDVALPGAGLLVWHIDETKPTNDDVWYPGCTRCTSHYKVALIQADNLYHLEKGQNSGDGKDPFPGTTGARSLSSSTYPDNKLYSGATSDFSLANISNSGETMTADILLFNTPVTTITGKPPSLVPSTSAIFSFSASKSSSFECRLDSGSFAGCTSPLTFAGLADGSHSFTVRATDLNGFREVNPPTWPWTIDTVPPDTGITSHPPDSAGTAPFVFVFSASEADVTFECAVDASAWRGCTSPVSMASMDNVTHIFSVRAKDSAGNYDPSPASFAWLASLTGYSVQLTDNAAVSYHASLTAAYNGISTGPAAMALRSTTISGNVLIDGAFPVSITGGYDAAFAMRDGTTTITGTLTIANGTVVLDGILLQ